MAKLGQLLVGRGWASTRAVQSALASQAAGGGRLGTNLLDSNVLTEDQLTRALAELHHLPGAGVEDLRGIPDEVIALIPARLARRVQAVPFKAFGTQVHVALANPGDLATQDEIVFAVSKRVVFYVAPEVRVAEALESYYGEPCSSRVASLVERLNRARFLWDRPEDDSVSAQPVLRSEWDEPAAALFTDAPRLPELAPPLSPPPRPPIPPPIPPPPRRPPAAPARPEVALSEPPPAAPPPIVAPRLALELPPPARTLDEALSRLELATDAEEIGQVLIEFLGRQFDRVGLFKTFRDRVVGWLGTGAELDSAAFVTFELSFAEPSVFLNLRTGGTYVLGPLARMPSHRRLTGLWGSPGGGTWLLLPARIHGRLVAVIALERNGETPRATDVEQGLAVSSAAALAFERCILRKKKE